jgi:hypothetical protein
MAVVAIDQNERQAILAALEMDAPLSHLEVATKGLIELLRQAHSGDYRAFQTYQEILYLDIHQCGETVRDPKRLWVAQKLYQAEEQTIPDVDDPGTSSPDEFKAFIDDFTKQRSRLTHPMSNHLYNEKPSLPEIDLFLEHHWMRSSLFYRFIGEFGLRLQNFEDSTPLFENLFDESGNGNPEKAHPILLQNLLRFREIPAEFDVVSNMAEEQAYLNNRIRCLRHPDLAWGLAVVYLTESVTAANHRKIHRMLQDAGIPDPFLEFHYIHGFVDEVHSADLWNLVARRCNDQAFRKKFLRSAQQHFLITQKYYDALWAEMKALNGDR